VKQLPLAMQTAFETLPVVIANLPELKNIFRHPFRIIHDLVSQADFWLDRLELKMTGRKDIIIVSGPEKSGKTNYVNELTTNLKRQEIKICGFVCPSVIENGVITGQDLIDLSSGLRFPLSRNTGTEDMPKVGNYFFITGTLEYGKALIDIKNLNENEVVIIDEVGPWELAGQGWADSLNQLVRFYNKPMIWVVRDSIVEKVIENWGLKGSKITDIKKDNVEDVMRLIK
jgi:nucleoside-triphosphatase THEP1